MNTDNNSFDPTPKLKSSPVPVLFIPFKNNEENCNYCGIEYSKSLEHYQKYCKNCLFRYIQDITDNNTYLDVRISTKNSNNSQCIEHKAKGDTTNIQEWCEYCSEIVYFTQVVTKVMPSQNRHYFYCGGQFSGYQISSGWVESTLTKKSIPILNLPWWGNHNQCVVCLQELKYIHQESKSHCQKWCSHCFIIYTGCRYCLTTNIIFGIADQSIDITDIGSGNYIIEEFLASTRINNKNLHSIVNYETIFDTSNPFNIYLFINNELCLSLYEKVIKWIPYSQIKNLKKIAGGGFSIIYKATWENTDVAVKKLHDSQNISKYFLNELRSLHQCDDNNDGVICCYGITQDPIAKEYMLILDYAEGGNLHDYLQKNFINIAWQIKLNILNDISIGLERIHNNNFIHRDIHSGNMLLSNIWKIGDLGLSQPANNTLSNNEIYGAENKRLELIRSKKLGPEFSEKSHSKAIYTSRALSSLISKASTINSSSMISFNVKQGYITKEYEFDINNIQSSFTQNTTSATHSLTVSANSLRKRNFEELKNETNETPKNRKYIKVDNLDDECCRK
ncbi:kinase-like protein [Rhizophagus irregularis]|nr:kinase-like protein [Rhizophagus irregularis]